MSPRGAAPATGARRRVAAAAALLCAVATPSAARVGAVRAMAGVVTVVGPQDDPLRAAAPSFVVATSGFAPSDPVVAVTLELSTRVDFTPPLLASASAAAASATLTLDRPLPERVTVFWRARARTVGGTEVLSDVVGPRSTPPWLVLLTPNAAGGSTVATRRPQFAWHSALATSPPGPWRYDLTVTNVATGAAIIDERDLADTTFTPAADLQANTSYRWSVVARLASGDSVRATSLATFVITDDGAPPATILYQNFPNPFPAIASSAAGAVMPPAGLDATCLWFDLARPSTVRLEIYTLRGDRVRTIVPNGALFGLLPAGRYGRATTSGAGSGCDPQLVWDGTAQDGRVVPAGVYLARLVADRTSSTRKIVFRGR